MGWFEFLDLSMILRHPLAMIADAPQHSSLVKVMRGVLPNVVRSFYCEGTTSRIIPGLLECPWKLVTS